MIFILASFIKCEINSSSSGALLSQVAPLGWTEVQGWAGTGGARLRTTRLLFTVNQVFVRRQLNCLSLLE